MRFLPVAEREIRVAARGPGLYRFRWIMGGVWLLVYAYIFWVYSWRRQSPTGPQMFGVLSHFAFAYSLLSGAVLTSDCVSREKREGTLGLLFLTDLKAIDIVAGNLSATSIKAFCGLLAIFPVLGLSLLMGGVEFGYFLRVLLVLMNTMFFSLAFGLLVSTFNRRQFAAVGWTTFGLVVVGHTVPLIVVALEQIARFRGQSSVVGPIVSFVTPYYSFAHADTLTRGRPWQDFYISCAIIHALAWAFLLVCCFLLARAWQDKPGAVQTLKWRARFRQWKFGSPEGRKNHRRRLLSKNPFYWLNSREMVCSADFFFVSVATAATAAWFTWIEVNRRAGTTGEPLVLAWFLVGLALHAWLLFRAATGAAAQMLEERNNGALELLFVTPLGRSKLLAGQWLGWRRGMTGPALAVFFIQGFVLWWLLSFIAESTPGAAVSPPKIVWLTALKFLGFPVKLSWDIAMVVLCFATFAAVIALHWVTLFWLARLLALRLKKPGAAPWVALGLVVVTPWPVFAWVVHMADQAQFSQAQFFWGAFVYLACVGLNVCNDLVLLAVSRRKLRREIALPSSSVPDAAAKAESRAVFRRRFLRLAVGTAVAALALVGLLKEERWRGQRALQRVQAKAFADKTPWRLKDLEPPAVPAAENMGAAPFFDLVFRSRFDSEAARRANEKARRELNLGADESHFNQPYWEVVPNSWVQQEPVDLRAWAAFYQARPLTAIAVSNSPAQVVLAVLARFDAPLEELEKAAARPACRFPLNYDYGVRGTSMEHVRFLENLAAILRLKAVAHLAQTQQHLAFREIQTQLRLADCLKTEPFALSQSARRSILSGALQGVWEGLSLHVWSLAQLVSFQEDLLSRNVLEEYPRVVWFSALGVMEFWGRVMTDATMGGNRSVFERAYPAGWAMANQARFYEQYPPKLLAVVDSRKRRVTPAADLEGGAWLSPATLRMDPFFQISIGDPPSWNFNPQPGLFSAPIEFAHCQTSLHEAAIACALERYYLSRNSYPPNLEALRPQYMETPPADVLTGQPLRYELRDSNRFVLYSPGWNVTDDHGNLSPGKAYYWGDPVNHLAEGDWVWKYPPPPRSANTNRAKAKKS